MLQIQSIFRIVPQKCVIIYISQKKCKLTDNGVHYKHALMQLCSEHA